MTDQQLLTLAIAVIVPISLLIYSNSRITDAKETLRAEIGQLRAEIRTDFTKIEAKLDTVINMLAHLDTRVNKLEERQT